ncbi:hypothetical protein JZO66_07655 [Enterococcus sp. DIV0242_7C1]|uniref:Uncharacterized protein n=1 Tax=Candidatus Enterococcus dunnyi TaxID=1834192 RepID=A0A200J063_9ENTE|nr:MULTISPECIES: hypothetical protein [unclassified Enterococcus]MBO0470417.1 hypothetical protein [Enterococcus sp. DIV0242_7C1]OUZ30219.1 hypothetical protein A5889_002507 [Enterococcus sp. 9D6_DIV0238]
MVYSESRQFSADQVRLKNEGKRLLNELDQRLNISDAVQKKQLELIYSEISSMINSIENQETKKIIASYPHFIADTWDYSDELGIRLLNFKDTYNKLMRKRT